MRVLTPRKPMLVGFTLLLAACANGVEDVNGVGDVGGGALIASLELFAGNLSGGRGNIDGTQPMARFNFPNGVATDSAGNVYVADTGNHTIRKITSAGAVTTLAGTAGATGSADGTGVAARFNGPVRVAADSMGNTYVADRYNHTIRKITSAGAVTTFAGTVGIPGSANGIGTAATFKHPNGVATDSAGNVYVADMENHTVRMITPAGIVTTLAGTAGTPGIADGLGTAASFNYPNGVATDSAGNVYVADYGNHTVRKITSAGVVTTLAGTAGMIGSDDATGAAARFSSLIDVATDSTGNIYVADYGNHTIRKITSAGAVTTFAGTVGIRGNADGTGTAASFSEPFDVATDSTDNVYVADIANHTIRKITSAGVVTTFAGTATAGSADGSGTAARFNSPEGLATDSAGNIYVGDAHSHTIRKITSAGVVTTLAGTAGTAGSADGIGTAARFALPYKVAADSAGNVYVADSGNHTIRKITADGTVTTFAGTAGTPDIADGTGTVARFNFPYGIATDSAGNIYVADRSNHTIRKITSAGAVTTLAGTAGIFGSADGIGTNASFTYPDGIATDSAGNIYVADRTNHIIRKITSAGVVTTLAGTAGTRGSADGAGAAASFNAPINVATDSSGNVYVSDFGNHTLRKITPAGVVTTVVGVVNQATFTPGALPGRLAVPLGVVVSGSSLYIALGNGIAVVRNRP